MFHFFSFQSLRKQELHRAAGGERVSSAASSYCPGNLLSLWLVESNSHISVIFTWTVLFPKMQHLFSYLEMEPFPCQGLPYLIGKKNFDWLLGGFWIIDLNSFDRCLPQLMEFFPFFYLSYEHLKWFVNSVYLFLCDLLKFMTGTN